MTIDYEFLKTATDDELLNKRDSVYEALSNNELFAYLQAIDEECDKRGI